MVFNCKHMWPEEKHTKPLENTEVDHKNDGQIITKSKIITMCNLVEAHENMKQ